MPSIIDEVSVKNRGRIYGLNFKWPDVMDGQSRLFVGGTDFNCDPEKFRAYCHTRASQKGYKARTAVVGNDVQAVFIPKK